MTFPSHATLMSRLLLLLTIGLVSAGCVYRIADIPTVQSVDPSGNPSLSSATPQMDVRPIGRMQLASLQIWSALAFLPRSFLTWRPFVMAPQS